MASLAFVSNPSLSPIQEGAIVLIAAGNPISNVAEQCKVHRNMIGYWRRTNPAFAQALADAQYDRTLYYRDAAEEHASLAIAVIAELLSNPKTPPAVRLRAALAMLKHATTAPPTPPVVAVPESVETPAPAPKLVPKPVVQKKKPQTVHNFAQSAASATTSETSEQAPNPTVLPDPPLTRTAEGSE